MAIVYSHLRTLRYRFLPCLLVLASTCSTSVRGETTVSGDLSLGYEYDSNVTVDELDRSSSVGDGGLVSSVNLALDHDINDDTSGSLSYGYSRIDYDQFDFLSRETHIIGANLSSRVGDVTFGMNYFYIDARLDGRDFLTYHRVSPSLSGFVSKKWFLRGAYVYGDKKISRRPGRDAENHGAELDLYYFWQGLRRYVNLGYVYRDEDSRADRFDYKAHQVKLRAVQRFEILGKLSTLELAIRYEDRDYSGITPSIGEERSDERYRLNIELAVPVTEAVTWSIYAGYSDYYSNLPSADYDQNLAGTRVEWAF